MEQVEKYCTSVRVVFENYTSTRLELNARKRKFDPDIDVDENRKKYIAGRLKRQSASMDAARSHRGDKTQALYRSYDIGIRGD